MKKNVFVLAFVSIFLATVLIIHVGASYLNGCNDCGGSVTAYCDGPIYGSPFSLSHKYGGFLGIGAKTCNYKEHVHATTEYCSVNPTHVNTGDNVHADYDHVCGRPDMTPCSMHHVAYNSGT